MRRYTEALTAVHRAVELDPLSARTSAMRGGFSIARVNTKTRWRDISGPLSWILVIFPLSAASRKPMNNWGITIKRLLMPRNSKEL
jgi:hypothetical protein